MSSAHQRHGIVVGVDGSPSSQAAVVWAARDAAMRNVGLTLVHVVAPVVSTGTDADIPAPSDYDLLQQAHAKQLISDAYDVVADATRQTGSPEVSSQVLNSPTIPALVDLSRETELIVLGRRGQGALGHVLMGSVGSGLVRHAHCPVAVVHEEYLSSPRADAPVLVGIDGSPASEVATRLAFDEASRRNVDITALHAWSDFGPWHVGKTYWAPDDWVIMRAREQEILAERLAGFRERYPDVTVGRIVVCDRPAHQLIKHAESAQLVVVGSHGRGGFAGMLLGSVSRAVVNSAQAPVIVARS